MEKHLHYYLVQISFSVNLVGLEELKQQKLPNEQTVLPSCPNTLWYTNCPDELLELKLTLRHGELTSATWIFNTLNL